MNAKPDQPNSPRHAELKAQWRQGQKWETLVEGAATWVPVSDGGYSEPLWDHNQEYRMVPAGVPGTPADQPKGGA